MISIVTTCKPFTGLNGVIQRNALRSWRTYLPGVEIIIGGAEPGVAEIAQEVRAVVIPDIARTEYGTPLLPSLLQLWQGVASNPVCAYVNADVLLLSDWYAALGYCRAYFRDCHFMAVGKRWDIDQNTAINFAAAAAEEAGLRTKVQQTGRLHGPFGLDYVVGHKGLWDGVLVPPFAVGRMRWDGWMLNNALLRRKITVDLSLATLVIHQSHDYAHIAGGLVDGPEIRANNALLAAAMGTDNTDLYMRPDGAIVSRC